MRVYHGIVKRTVIAMTALGFASTLGGCGAVDGVDINLPVVGNIMKKQKRTETALAERGALILPPKSAAAALPTPGSGAVAMNNQSWPQDPELRAKKIAALKAAKKKKEIAEGNFKSYNGQEGFDRATDSFERRQGIFEKYYNK